MNRRGAIVSAAYRELRRIAEQEGPEGRYLLEQAEFCVDAHGGNVVLSLQFGREVVWKSTLPISRAQIDDGAMPSAEMEQHAVAAMRKSLSVVGQYEHARLNKYFPKSIDRVEVNYDANANEKTFKVHFKNGHVAEGTQSEMSSDYFMARCTMIYDLPPL